MIYSSENIGFLKTHHNMKSYRAPAFSLPKTTTWGFYVIDTKIYPDHSKMIAFAETSIVADLQTMNMLRPSKQIMYP